MTCTVETVLVPPQKTNISTVFHISILGDTAIQRHEQLMPASGLATLQTPFVKSNSIAR